MGWIWQPLLPASELLTAPAPPVSFKAAWAANSNVMLSAGNP